jgi:AcrR family transcriptional regulator
MAIEKKKHFSIDKFNCTVKLYNRDSIGKVVPMRKLRKDAYETRQRLLVAASEVFAEKGFWEATHAEICRKAKTNIAAVNYHFGTKENLYVEAWKYAFERSMEAYPPDGGVAAGAPAKDRLRGQIVALMHRVGDPDNHEVEIIHKEMANPTGLLTETLRRVMETMRSSTRSIIAELLGDGVGELQTDLCEMSVMSQCMGPMLRLRHVRKSPEVQPPGPLPFDLSVEDLADHVVQFSLAGIGGIRNGAQKSKKGGKKLHRGKRASK